MELCRWTTISRAHTAIAPFLPAPLPSSPLRDFKKRRMIVCLSSSNSKSTTKSPKNTQKAVSITGATGFIGRRLVQKLLAVDNFPEVIIAEEEEWKKCIEDSNAIVNLAGMPISTRWSPEIKKEIKQSRINVTSKVVDLINYTSAEVRPSVLVSATAIGYYGTSETQVFDETSPSGNDYLSEVCREWEAKAHNVDNGVRLVLIRIGVVLGKDGGALAKMIPLFMMFAGGPLGTGKQWFSWIHLDDLVNLICESLINSSYKGGLGALQMVLKPIRVCGSW